MRTKYRSLLLLRMLLRFPFRSLQAPIRSQQSLETKSVIRRRTVNRRNLYVVQAQIDAKLSTVMYQMIEEHLAIRHEPRALEDDLLPEHKLPVIVPGVILHAGKRLPCLGCAFIEESDQLGRRLHRRRFNAS